MDIKLHLVEVTKSLVSQREAEWKKSPSCRKKGLRLADAADAAYADRGGSDEERSANSIYGSAEDKKKSAGHLPILLSSPS